MKSVGRKSILAIGLLGAGLTAGLFAAITAMQEKVLRVEKMAQRVEANLPSNSMGH